MPSLARPWQQDGGAESGFRWKAAKKLSLGCLRFAVLWGNNPAAPTTRRDCLGCGCSSGVEHNLAKVGVEGSNPFARSRQSQGLRSMQASDLPALFAFWAWAARHCFRGFRKTGEWMQPALSFAQWLRQTSCPDHPRSALSWVSCGGGDAVSGKLGRARHLAAEVEVSGRAISYAAVPERSVGVTSWRQPSC